MLKKSTKKRLFLAVVLLIISANFVRSTFLALESRKRLDDALEKEKSMTAERDSLKKTIEYKKTDDYIEESARNDLRMVKDGETIYVVPGGGSVAGAESVLEGKPKDVCSEGCDTGHVKKGWSNAVMWYKVFF